MRVKFCQKQFGGIFDASWFPVWPEVEYKLCLINYIIQEGIFDDEIKKKFGGIFDDSWLPVWPEVEEKLCLINYIIPGGI